MSIVGLRKAGARRGPVSRDRPGGRPETPGKAPDLRRSSRVPCPAHAPRCARRPATRRRGPPSPSTPTGTVPTPRGPSVPTPAHGAEPCRPRTRSLRSRARRTGCASTSLTTAMRRRGPVCPAPPGAHGGGFRLPGRAGGAAALGAGRDCAVKIAGGAGRARSRRATVRALVSETGDGPMPETPPKSRAARKVGYHSAHGPGKGEPVHARRGGSPPTPGGTQGCGA